MKSLLIHISDREYNIVSTQYSSRKKLMCKCFYKIRTISIMVFNYTVDLLHFLPQNED
jgi:hypothetical protein